MSKFHFENYGHVNPRSKENCMSSNNKTYIRSRMVIRNVRNSICDFVPNISAQNDEKIVKFRNNN